MSSWAEKQWRGRTGRKLGVALPFGMAFWLLVQVVYTPIHILQESHTDELSFNGTTRRASTAVSVSDDDQDEDGHAGEHSAEQHKLKALRSGRLVLNPAVLVLAVQWVDTTQDDPQPPMFAFLSRAPPELHRSWQFIFRTALPIRAPSILS